MVFDRMSHQTSNGTYARDLMLVLEIEYDEDARGYIVIEGNGYKLQMYDFRRADLATHYNISKTFQLEQKVQAWKSEEHEEWDGMDPPPKKFYTILLSDRDHFLRDVIVVNSIEDDEVMSSLAEIIPWEWGATSLSQLAHVGGSKKRHKISDEKNIRGNARYDIGYSGQNTRDGSTVPGINIPSRIVNPHQGAGANGDVNQELTLYKAGCAVVAVADYIRIIHEEKIHESMSGGLFCGDEQRHEKFARVWWNEMKNVMETEDDLKLIEFARFEGLSMFATGELRGGALKKTEAHRDRRNGHAEGYDRTPTLTKIVIITDDNGESREVRLGVNTYSKRDCETALLRLVYLRAVSMFVKDSMDRYEEECPSIALHKKFCPSAAAEAMYVWKGTNEDAPQQTLVFRADNDKSGYYSIFANEIRRVGKISGWNRALMVEALYTVHLTPCPLTWFYCMQETVKVMERIKREGGDWFNLVEVFVGLRLQQDEGVGCGSYLRCQPGAKTVVQSDLMRSCRNLDNILTDMCDPANNDTAAFVRRIKKSPMQGGCANVGGFHAASMIHIAVMCGLVTVTDHVERITIAKSTMTARRLMGMLRSKFPEVKSDSSSWDTMMKDLVPFVGRFLGVTNAMAENCICEAFRRESKPPVIKYDVFVCGHRLLVVESDGVKEVGLRGTKRRVDFEDVTHNDWYQPKVEWWNDCNGSSAILIHLHNN